MNDLKPPAPVGNVVQSKKVAMNLLQAWLLLVTFAAGLLPTSVLASVCDPRDLPYREWNISSQAQLDELSQCTTLDGRLSIWHSYEGPFVLRNVQNITDSITAWPNKEGLDPKVTSMELPDLLYMAKSFTDMPTLTKFSAPKLISAEMIEMYRTAAVSTVDLSSLRSVGVDLLLTGDFSSINLNSLHNASTLTICNKRCLTTPEWKDAVAQALDIDLPFLETAGQLSIRGNISSISAPRLQTVTPGGLFLDILSRQPIALSFPRLHSAGSWINIVGRVANLDIPMLRNMASFILSTSWPIHFNLGAESLSVVELEGEFQSIELPNLKTYKAIKIKSTGLFDCDSFEKKLSRRAKSNDSVIECSPYRPKPMVMRPEDKAAFTVIGLALVALIVFLVKQKRKPCRCSKGVPCESEVGLLSRAPGDQESDIPLPPYSPNPPSGH
ncbi:hypothetical protein BDW59DRAFT_144296 [Aspergillus cavernicola]|uniref:Uncharacterized protein n=1 Tax=Aspergillus cavernicola TaxID=176166 RepID=A0ABR4IK03_9EURO